LIKLLLVVLFVAHLIGAGHFGFWWLGLH